ncbi:MAG TPA: hypothetical protein VMV10_29090 [Pirellulales bacterium]|nr:hypothetical protein [Pirellulales bacterium]
MTGLLVCLSAVALGVDYGWQPIAGGGIEYVIQIEPQMLEALKRGEDLSSALPAGAQNIRRYRIVVGEEQLPHHGEPLPAETDEEPPAKISEVEDETSVAGDAAAKWTMPLESPYPSNYEQAGIPLPGPVLNPPMIAGPALEQPRLPPDADDVAQTEEQPDAFESHRAGKPPVEPPPEDPPRNEPVKQAPKKSIFESGPLFSAEEPEAGEQDSLHPSVKAAAKAPATVEKEHAAKDDELQSPSDSAPASAEPTALKANSTTLVGLFASLGGNVFLLWVASGQRSRYRALLRRSRESLAAASFASLPDAPEHDDSPRWETIPDDECERETN